MLGSAERRRVRPRGFLSPQKVRAVALLTMMMLGVLASEYSNSRPISNGMCMVLKYPGFTMRQSTGTLASGGRMEFSVAIIGWLYNAPAPNGMPLETDALRAPGSAANDSIISRKNKGALVLAGYLPGGSDT